MPKRLANPTLIVNNLATMVVPNSIKYREGTGEQTVTTQAAGNTIQTVFADNAETKMSFLGFSLTNTPENIALVRGWKNLTNANAATLSGEGGFSRAFNNMAVTNDYDVNLGSDTTIDIEMMGDPAV
jgi:hypothetical protein